MVILVWKMYIEKQNTYNKESKLVYYEDPDHYQLRVENISGKRIKLTLKQKC